MRLLRVLPWTIAWVACAGAATATAAPGDLDPSYAGTGWVRTLEVRSAGNNYLPRGAGAVAVQPDGCGEWKRSLIPSGRLGFEALDRIVLASGSCASKPVGRALVAHPHEGLDRRRRRGAPRRAHGARADRAAPDDRLGVVSRAIFCEPRVTLRPGAPFRG
jgi:hypothetical protein